MYKLRGFVRFWLHKKVQLCCTSVVSVVLAVMCCLHIGKLANDAVCPCYDF